ncbi:MAG: hydantoinase/oxoprolinase family protein [Gammaproteobacteria bacterium]
MGYQIGTDIGGTFTDLVLARDGRLLGRYKSPTTPGELSRGVLDCLALAAQGAGLNTPGLLRGTDVFVHGSTVATNAVLEQRGARCGVICTRGTRYTLWRGEGRRRDIFNFTAPPRAPLVRPYLCQEVDERVDRDGQVLRPLAEDDVIAAIERLRELGCTAAAISLLWSVRNPDHEQRVAALVRQHWPEAALSLSSEVQPILREYTRMSCTVLNAMLKPVVADYLTGLDADLRTHDFAGELLIVTSDGGLQPVSEVSERPVYMLFSGPATGPGAAAHFAASEAGQDCLLIDMGGTSFDVSTVIGGRIAVTRDGRINDYPTGVSAVQILTLGAGGGSVACVDEGGLLRVGPRSAGAQPGPACYGRGGTEATVTDAYLVLGYLAAERFLGGRMMLDRAAATAAIEQHVARPLDISIEDAALGICRVANESMINGILEMTVRRGIDPRRLLLVTGGGATGVAAVELARELGISRVVVPRETSVLCAFGALNADRQWSSVASHPTSLRAFDYDAVNATVARLFAAGEAFLERLRVPAAARHIEIFAAARYPMQVTEIEVPCPSSVLDARSVAQVADRFHAAHQERYAVSEPGSDVEFVMWRVVARGANAGIAGGGDGTSAEPFVIGDTELFDAESRTRRVVPLIDIERMGVGDVVTGPALMVAADTTVVAPAGTRVSARSGGHLLIEIDLTGRY